MLFECPTIEKLARRVEGLGSQVSSRLVPLRRKGTGNPVYCWPGLGGYPMNLRLLADRMGETRPFYGVQAYGINPGEAPYPTIGEMAAEDVKAIRRLQPTGPYTLWGYSFGARVAFETAYRLEQAGERVDHLFLIAPGSPKVDLVDGPVREYEAGYDNKAYVTILFSVFAGTITGPLLERCLAEARDEDTFAAFIHRNFPALDIDLVRRIMRVVGQTFEFSYTFRELAQRRIQRRSPSSRPAATTIPSWRTAGGIRPRSRSSSTWRPITTPCSRSRGSTSWSAPSETVSAPAVRRSPCRTSASSTSRCPSATSSTPNSSRP